MDIMDVDVRLGQFDYIIAHGVFSWVPPEVQEKVLEICRRNLSRNGVAYVSYNTYPGWHMMGIIRDMMLYHTRGIADPQTVATEARALLDFLVESVPADESAYGSFLNMHAQFLQGELKGAHHTGNAFLLHDELEEVNEPIYFHQFAARAERRGLKYLGEAEFRTMLDTNFPPQVSEKLREMAKSVVDLEQYMDFVRNRMFRQTLLCHQDVTLSRTLTFEQLKAFYVASRAQPVEPEPDLHSVTVVKFRASDGAILSTDHPVSKAAMIYLDNIWPQVASFDTLLTEARLLLGLQDESDIARDAQALATNLLRAHSYSGNLVELYVHAPGIPKEISEHPIANAVARLQVQGGARVTNLRHERVSLDEFDRYLLPYLDGSRDRVALAKCLEVGPVAEGALSFQVEDEPIQDPAQLRDILVKGVDKRLRWLARAALLVG
jgi:methyltransferase-like protein